jgi:hypothetical protein
MTEASSYWNLYWVESDGLEDCFVVARNNRSACSVECEMNGFDIADVHATKIMRLPEAVGNSYKKQKEYKEHPWPSYVYGKKFFKALGAQFRTIEKKEEMLLENVVYEVDEYVPCSIYRRRSIGFKAVEELRKIPELVLKYDDEDIWKKPEIHLITALGMCLVRCQQIEHYIAQSFLLGISQKQKRKYETINDLRAGWKKKTLGNMLQCIEEAWEIKPLVKENFELFLNNRNILIHGITTDERFDIQTHWGQLELLAFLNFFDVHSRIVKKAFRASYYASIQFGIDKFGVPKGTPKNIFSKKQKEEMSLFFEFFSPRLDCI